MITALCHSLKELLLTQRVAILFMESHNSPKAELSTLRRTLWDGALADLTEDGLLLIDFSDLSQSPVDAVIWPPSPNLVFDLPDRYDEYSRAAARDDLIRIALDDGLYPDSSGATAFAETALALSDNIRDLHARLSLMVTQLVKSNEQ